MAISPLLPSAGVALGALAAGTWKGVSTVGTSFVDALHRGLATPTDEGHAKAGGTSEGAPLGPSAADLKKELELFTRRLRERLAAAGIDDSVPIELKSDGRGGVVVDDPHPQRAAIEAIFAANPELAATFDFLAAAATTDDVLRASAGDQGRGEYRLQLTNGGARVRFE